MEDFSDTLPDDASVGLRVLREMPTKAQERQQQQQHGSNVLWTTAADYAPLGDKSR